MSDFEERTVNSLYFDIDVLVDTRLALIYAIDKELAKRLLMDGKYFKRVRDDFEYLSHDVFRDVYSRRSKILLKTPSPTKMPSLIAEYYIEASQADLVTGGDGSITMFVNTYPYILDESEVDTLAESIRGYIHEDVNITMIDLPPSAVTPEWMDSNIGMGIMYDALAWVDLHTMNDNLTLCSIPEVTLLTPKMVDGFNILSVKDTEKLFVDASKSLAPLVNIQFLPVEMFSIKLKLKKSNV